MSAWAIRTSPVLEAAAVAQVLPYVGQWLLAAVATATRPAQRSPAPLPHNGSKKHDGTRSCSSRQSSLRL